MKNIFNFNDFFVNEELTKLPATYNFAKSETEDKKHDRLASKKKDNHTWKKSTAKHGEKSMTQKFECPCGYKKSVENDENKKVKITYSKK